MTEIETLTLWLITLGLMAIAVLSAIAHHLGNISNDMRRNSHG